MNGNEPQHGAHTPQMRGRGTSQNPANRFTHLEIVPDAEALEAARQAHEADVAADEENGQPPEADPFVAPTRYFVDASRSILVRNDSPDVNFSVSINPYRGCEHGCIYCYARPSHEYFGLSAGLDFETVLFVKRDAPELLRRELKRPSYAPEPIALSGVTDPYQPIEREFRITRGVLEVLTEFRHPVGIVTKNALVTRDLDLLGALAQQYGAARVMISVTTLDPRLKRILEPRASSVRRRLDAIRQLAEAGVPVGVLVAPIIPGLTEHEIPSILEQAADAGATSAGSVMLRLPHAVKDLFADWLERHLPEAKEKVLGRVRQMRDGELNDSRFGRRMRGSGPLADQIHDLFRLAKRKAGLEAGVRDPLSTASFRVPGRTKSLFD